MALDHLVVYCLFCYKVAEQVSDWNPDSSNATRLFRRQQAVNDHLLSTRF